MADQGGPSEGPQPLGIALEHATDRIPTAHQDDRIGDLREGLAGSQFDSAEEVAVLDGTILVGLIPIEHLLAAEADQTAAEIMDSDPPVVSPDTDQEIAAWKMVERRDASLAVVDEGGSFQGLIPPYRMLSVLLAEHDEDVARLGGHLAGATQARNAAREPVTRRLRHRAPWLLLGLVGAMGSALIVGAFEDRLEANVLLAFFIPAVVYMADAVGTQTETVLIRAMAAEVTVRDVLRRELMTGLLMGLLVGGAFLVFALLGWGDARVAIAVAIALFASCSIATLVAMALPSVFQRFGKDPAFGSGPLATAVQDLLSIAVYFGVVAIVVV